MAYCTIAEVLDNHERLKLSNVIQKFITDADAIIDSYLMSVYALPFSATPLQINFVSINLATHFALRRVVGAQAEDYHAWIALYWDQSIELLNQMREGSIALTNISGEEIQRRTMITSTTKGKEAIFNLGNVYDQEYHDEASDERYGEGS